MPSTTGRIYTIYESCQGGFLGSGRSVLPTYIGVGERLRQLREALGFDRGGGGQAGLANLLRHVVPGLKWGGSRISDFEISLAGKQHQVRPWHVAVIALLHTDPLATVRWLTKGGTMPHLSLNRGETGAGVVRERLVQLAAPGGAETQMLTSVVLAAVRKTIETNEIQFAQTDVLVDALLAFAEQLKKRGLAHSDILEAAAYITRVREQGRE